MTSRAVAALAHAEPTVFWLADAARPAPAPALIGETTADLVVVGGGYTGLWAALQAKEDDPSRDVLVLEGNEVGWAASGRNGGFCAASLTHGEANGLDRFAGEFDVLQRMGRENLAGIEETLTRHHIDAEWERTGELDFATAPWQVDDLRELAELVNEHGGIVGVPRRRPGPGARRLSDVPRRRP